MTRPAGLVFIAQSVDGFIARRDGSIDWLSMVEKKGEDYGYRRFFESVDALVLGRATYEVVLGFGAWPYGGKRVVVLTHRPRRPKHGEELLAARPAALMRRLGREGLKRVYVDGGSVVSQFLAAGLVDELTVSTLPIVLGAGIRLFQGGIPERRLKLVRSRQYPSGLVQTTWRVKRGS